MAESTQNILPAADAASFNRRKKNGALVFRICMYALMTVIGLILIFPYLFMISKSLMSTREVSSAELVLIPAVPQFSNFLEVMQDSNYLAGLGNTMYVIVFNLIAVPLSATFIGIRLCAVQIRGQERFVRLHALHDDAPPRSSRRSRCTGCTTPSAGSTRCTRSPFPTSRAAARSTSFWRAPLCRAFPKRLTMPPR